MREAKGTPHSLRSFRHAEDFGTSPGSMRGSKPNLKPGILSSYRLPFGALTGTTPQEAQGGDIQVHVLTVTVMVSGAPQVLG